MLRDDGVVKKYKVRANITSFPEPQKPYCGEWRLPFQNMGPHVKVGKNEASWLDCRDMLRLLILLSLYGAIDGFKLHGNPLRPRNKTAPTIFLSIDHILWLGKVLRLREGKFVPSEMCVL